MIAINHALCFGLLCTDGHIQDICISFDLSVLISLLYIINILLNTIILVFVIFICFVWHFPNLANTIKAYDIKVNKVMDVNKKFNHTSRAEIQKLFNHEINLDSQASKGLPDIGNGHKNSRYFGTKSTALRHFVLWMN